MVYAPGVYHKPTEITFGDGGWCWLEARAGQTQSLACHGYRPGMSRNVDEQNHDPEQELVSRRLELAVPSFEHQGERGR
jgi:hypothetical protein